MKPKITARSLRRWWLLVLAWLGLALAACTGVRSTVATVSPTAQLPLTQTAQHVPTRYITLTPSITTTQTQLPTPQPTATATPTPVVKQYAVTIEPELPSDYHLEGALVLRPQNGKDYLLDLGSMSEHLFPTGNNFFPSWTWLTISPDRRRFAYLELKPQGYHLRIVTAEGQSQPVSNWPDDQQWEIIGWLDDQRLALADLSRFDGTVKVFDTLTGEWQELVPPFPVSSPNGDLSSFDSDIFAPFVIYDPTLSRAVLARFLPSQNLATYELWDVQSKVILWERRTGAFFASTPIWSPAGDRFALIYRPYSKQYDPTLDYAGLYLVDRNGKETQLADFAAVSLAWSPDGRFIATWWRGPFNDDHFMSNALAVVDVVSRETSVHLFVSEGLLSAAQYPLWSPDGRWVAFNEAINDETSNRVIVLDLVQKRAFEVARDVVVKGWMAATP